MQKYGFFAVPSIIAILIYTYVGDIFGIFIICEIIFINRAVELRYGMNLMSSGLQKASGDKLRGFLTAMTSNPFKGVMTGLGITSVIQSS